MTEAPGAADPTNLPAGEAKTPEAVLVLDDSPILPAVPVLSCCTRDFSVPSSPTVPEKYEARIDSIGLPHASEANISRPSTALPYDKQIVFI